MEGKLNLQEFFFCIYVFKSKDMRTSFSNNSVCCDECFTNFKISITFFIVQATGGCESYI